MRYKNHKMGYEAARLGLAMSPVILWLLALAILNWSGALFVVLMFGGAALNLFLYFRIRCPNCGKSLLLRERKGTLLGPYTFFTFERTCSRCGERQVP